MTCVAFDIDGTIYDCGDIVVDAFQEGARRFGELHRADIATPSREEILQHVGIPTDEIFVNLYPLLGAAAQRELNDLSMESLSALVRDGGGILYEGVRETITQLFTEGKRILAASNGKLPYIKAILETYGLVEFFEEPLVVVDDELNDKSDIVRHYLDHRCNGELLIMVGDRESDVRAAKVNGVPFIGCAFGHAGTEEIRGERWIVEDFSEIPDVVKAIEDMDVLG
ncbi:MAG TPA: HAD family hydrolase [Spirochaetota bacterium]|nr:HAD family hydrolase [Spirochaetota bacterium]HQO02791.1 HAD family hydrolase [Spirochaetota bacterium]HQP49851.1 HAD family hydrolase [Spirochaetota bacterium]